MYNRQKGNSPTVTLYNKEYFLTGQTIFGGHARFNLFSAKHTQNTASRTSFRLAEME
jgi:hypothetical protein